DAFQFFLVHYGKQTAFFIADKAAVNRSNMFDDVRVAPVEHIHEFGQPRQTGRLAPFERRRRTQRKQANQRSHFQSYSMSIGKSEEVIIETVFFVPHLIVMTANPIHRIGNPDEVFEELVSRLLIDRVVLGKDNGDLKHDLAKQGDPCGAIGLFNRSPGRRGGAAIKHANVIQAEKSSGEDIAPLRGFSVYPPGEIDQQALETLFQKLDVGPAPLILNLIQEQRSPGMDGRINVAKVPLVCRNLSIGMEVEIAQHKELLLFGEIEINQRQGEGVKGQ